MGIFLTSFVVALLAVSTAFARPISYTDSFTFMTLSDDSRDSVYVHYSPSFKRSVGIEISDDKTFRTTYGLLRYTQLLFRKNTRKSQTNLYFISGLGLSETKNYNYGVQGDWETRKYFLGFKYNQNNFFGARFRDQYFMVGIVPYIGKYGDLHTWIMLKSKKNSLTNENHLYPILKFFKGDSLLEIGYDNQQKIDLHFVQRF